MSALDIEAFLPDSFTCPQYFLAPIYEYCDQMKALQRYFAYSTRYFLNLEKNQDEEYSRAVSGDLKVDFLDDFDLIDDLSCDRGKNFDWDGIMLFDDTHIPKRVEVNCIAAYLDVLHDSVAVNKNLLNYVNVMCLNTMFSLFESLLKGLGENFGFKGKVKAPYIETYLAFLKASHLNLEVSDSLLLDIIDLRKLRNQFTHELGEHLNTFRSTDIKRTEESFRCFDLISAEIFSAWEFYGVQRKREF